MAKIERKKISPSKEFKNLLERQIRNIKSEKNIETKKTLIGLARIKINNFGTIKPEDEEREVIEKLIQELEEIEQDINKTNEVKTVIPEKLIKDIKDTVHEITDDAAAGEKRAENIGEGGGEEMEIAVQPVEEEAVVVAEAGQEEIEAAIENNEDITVEPETLGKAINALFEFEIWCDRAKLLEVLDIQGKPPERTKRIEAIEKKLVELGVISLKTMPGKNKKGEERIIMQNYNLLITDKEKLIAALGSLDEDSKTKILNEVKIEKAETASEKIDRENMESRYIPTSKQSVQEYYQKRKKEGAPCVVTKRELVGILYRGISGETQEKIIEKLIEEGLIKKLEDGGYEILAGETNNVTPEIKTQKEQKIVEIEKTPLQEEAERFAGIVSFLLKGSSLEDVIGEMTPEDEKFLKKLIRESFIKKTTLKLTKPNRHNVDIYSLPDLGKVVAELDKLIEKLQKENSDGSSDKTIRILEGTKHKILDKGGAADVKEKKAGNINEGEENKIEIIEMGTLNLMDALDPDGVEGRRNLKRLNRLEEAQIEKETEPETTQAAVESPIGQEENTISPKSGGFFEKFKAGFKEFFAEEINVGPEDINAANKLFLLITFILDGNNTLDKFEDKDFIKRLVKGKLLYKGVMNPRKNGRVLDIEYYTLKKENILLYLDSEIARYRKKYPEGTDNAIAEELISILEKIKSLVSQTTAEQTAEASVPDNTLNEPVAEQVVSEDTEPEVPEEAIPTPETPKTPEQAYQQALRLNTVEAFEKFIAANPDAKGLLVDADKKIKELEKKAEESANFEQAKEALLKVVEEARNEWVQFVKTNKKPAADLHPNYKKSYEDGLKLVEDSWTEAKRVYVKFLLENDAVSGQAFARVFLVEEEKFRQLQEKGLGKTVSKIIEKWDKLGEAHLDENGKMVEGNAGKRLLKSALTTTLLGLTTYFGIQPVLEVENRVGNATTYLGKRLEMALGFSVLGSIVGSEAIKNKKVRRVLQILMTTSGVTIALATGGIGAAGLAALSTAGGMVISKLVKGVAKTEDQITKERLELGNKGKIDIKTLEADIKKFEQDCADFEKMALKQRVLRKLVQGAGALAGVVATTELYENVNLGENHNAPKQEEDQDKNQKEQEEIDRIKNNISDIADKELSKKDLDQSRVNISPRTQFASEYISDEIQDQPGLLEKDKYENNNNIDVKQAEIEESNAQKESFNAFQEIKKLEFQLRYEDDPEKIEEIQEELDKAKENYEKIEELNKTTERTEEIIENEDENPATSTTQEEETETQTEESATEQNGEEKTETKFMSAKSVGEGDGIAQTLKSLYTAAGGFDTTNGINETAGKVDTEVVPQWFADELGPNPTKEDWADFVTKIGVYDVDAKLDSLVVREGDKIGFDANENLILERNGESFVLAKPDDGDGFVKGDWEEKMQNEKFMDTDKYPNTGSTIERIDSDEITKPGRIEKLDYLDEDDAKYQGEGHQYPDQEGRERDDYYNQKNTDTQKTESEDINNRIETTKENPYDLSAEDLQSIHTKHENNIDIIFKGKDNYFVNQMLERQASEVIDMDTKDLNLQGQRLVDYIEKLEKLTGLRPIEKILLDPNSGETVTEYSERCLQKLASEGKWKEMEYYPYDDEFYKLETTPTKQPGPGTDGYQTKNGGYTTSGGYGKTSGGYTLEN